MTPSHTDAALAAAPAPAASSVWPLAPEMVVRLSPRMQARLAEGTAAAHATAERVSEAQKPRLTLLRTLMQLAQEPRIGARERVSRLRRLVDTWGKDIAPHSACKKGCSHCCHIPVAVFRSEAEAIGREIGLAPARKVAPMDRGRAIGYDKPCVFLKDGQCRIHASRPLACRTHFNLDRDDLLCELVPGVPVPVPYADARQLNLVIASQFFGDTVAELNDWFPGGLNGPVA